MLKKEELTYESAFQELVDLQTALENDEITVDEVAAKVKKAQELIAFCQQKRKETESEISIWEGK